MRFSPKKNKMGALIALFLCLLGCFGMVFAVTCALKYALFLQLFCLFLFIFSFEFLYRYELSTFTYLCDEKSFAVIRAVGNKKTALCNLDMESALAIIKTPKKRAKRVLEKEHGRASIRYNHCAVMRPKASYSIFFEFNGRVAQIIFEPSEEMVRFLAARIAENEDAWAV